jgi:hypothetical protein
VLPRAMRHGAMPYAYGFDNKPPMIFYWYYLSFGLFGESVWAPPDSPLTSDRTR